MAKSHTVAEKSHASLGASKAERWWECPGSVRLEEGLPDVSSEYAAEGTGAHALAELGLRNSVDLLTYLGTKVEGVEVTEEMCEHVAIFTDYCLSLRNVASQEWIEKRFNLRKLNPPTPMFGTGDYVALMGRTLEVVDLKYGVGVVVEATNSKQLQYYALGVLLELEDEGIRGIDEIKLTIVQPRASHKDGMVRSFTLSYSEMLDFASELLAAARRTQEPDAPLHPGRHCRFCKASGRCPAQLAAAQTAAMVEFSAMPVDLPPDPALIPIDTLAEWHAKFHLLEAWMKSVTGRLQSTLESGVPVPGLKLVARRANRSWVSETETQQWLDGYGVARDAYLDMSLKSPAQIEKVVGKKNLPADLTQKVSSGYSMVSIDDARPGVELHPGEEFGAITAAPETAKS